MTIVLRRAGGIAGSPNSRPTSHRRPLVGDLPHAEKAIVALARAMEGNARVIVLDEPTAALPTPDAARVAPRGARGPREGRRVHLRVASARRGFRALRSHYGAARWPYRRDRRASPTCASGRSSNGSPANRWRPSGARRSVADDAPIRVRGEWSFRRRHHGAGRFFDPRRRNRRRHRYHRLRL